MSIINRFVLLSGLLLLTSSCDLPKAQQLNIQTYLFNPVYPHTATPLLDHSEATKEKPSIKIYPVSAIAPFDTSFLIFKLKNNRFQEDYYHRFLASPATQLQQIAMYYLKGSNNFSKILNIDTVQIPNYAIIFTLQKLYVDTTSPNQWYAVMTIDIRVNKLSLLDNPVLFFDHTYSERIPINHTENNVEPILSAWDKAIETLFNRFNKDWKTYTTPTKLAPHIAN